MQKLIYLFFYLQVIQQGWGAVVRWGGRLSQNLAELSLSAVKKDEMNTDLQAQAGSDYTPVSSSTQVPWGLGRLFGASKTPTSPTGHTQPTRSVIKYVIVIM